MTVPANARGTNGGVRITVSATAAGTNNTKTLRVKFGGTTVATLSWSQPTASGGYVTLTIMNRNATGSQVFGGIGMVGNTSQEFSSTVSKDTTASVDVTVTGETPNASDEVTVHSIVVEVISD